MSGTILIKNMATSKFQVKTSDLLAAGISIGASGARSTMKMGEKILYQIGGRFLNNKFPAKAEALSNRLPSKDICVVIVATLDGNFRKNMNFSSAATSGLWEGLYSYAGREALKLAGIADDTLIGGLPDEDEVVVETVV